MWILLSNTRKTRVDTGRRRSRRLARGAARRAVAGVPRHRARVARRLRAINERNTHTPSLLERVAAESAFERILLFPRVKESSAWWRSSQLSESPLVVVSALRQSRKESVSSSSRKRVRGARCIASLVRRRSLRVARRRYRDLDGLHRAVARHGDVVDLGEHLLKAIRFRRSWGFQRNTYPKTRASGFSPSESAKERPRDGAQKRRRAHARLERVHVALAILGERGLGRRHCVSQRFEVQMGEWISLSVLSLSLSLSLKTELGPFGASRARARSLSDARSSLSLSLSPCAGKRERAGLAPSAGAAAPRRTSETNSSAVAYRPLPQSQVTPSSQSSYEGGARRKRHFLPSLLRPRKAATKRDRRGSLQSVLSSLRAIRTLWT